MALLAATSLPVVAQSQATPRNPSRPALSSLPDGNYFYGTSRSPYQSGSDYLIFRKKGTSITGIRYPVPGETTCFKGTAGRQEITNVTIRFEPLGLGEEPEFLSRPPINVSSYYKLRFDQSPDFAGKGLQECIRVFANRK